MSARPDGDRWIQTINSPELDVAAFDQGVTANSLLWNFDQGVIGGSRPHRIEARKLLVRLRGQASHFSEMKTGEPLEAVLGRVEEKLNILESRPEWLSDHHVNAIQHAMNDSHDSSTEGQRYCEIMREQFPDYRNELNEALVDQVLKTSQQREHFRSGSWIDSIRRPTNVGEYMVRLVYKNSEPDESATAVLGDQAACQTSEEVTERGERRDPEVEPQPILVTWGPGEFPPRDGAWQVILEIYHSLGLYCRHADSFTKAKTPHSVDAVVTEIIEDIRLGLMPSRFSAPISSVESLVTGSPQLTTGNQSSPPLSDDKPKSVDDGQAGGSVQTPPPDDEPTTDENEIIGHWTFRAGTVAFKNVDTFELVNQPRRLLKHLLRSSSRSDWVAWTTLADGKVFKRAKKSPIQRKTVTKIISDLRLLLSKQLKDYLSENNICNPILSTGMDDDLAFQIPKLLL